MIICQLIQIIIYTKETLSEYYEKVKHAVTDLLYLLNLGLDFDKQCPICGAEDCAHFIEYYRRKKVIDWGGNIYKDFPIARYLCRNTGKTFSLLPYQLIPYRKYSISFIIETLKLRHEEGLTIYRLQDHLASFGEDEIIAINVNQLYEFKKIIRESVWKIKATKAYPGFDKETSNEKEDTALLNRFIEFAQRFECLKHNPSIKGPCGLSYDFYLNGGGYFTNAYFLFGTASQFR